MPNVEFMSGKREKSMEGLRRDFFQYTDVHGIPVNLSSMDHALREVETLILRRERGRYVCFFEANLFFRASRDAKVREAIRQAVLVYPDGIAPAKSASWCTGVAFERISGPSFMLQACSYGLSRQWRHFLLGGAEGVAEKLAANLQKRFPGLQIAGTCCPPFRQMTEAEERALQEKIEQSRADLLWVALGGPKQEFWMQAHQGKIDVPVMLGVGAAFDFHSGNRPWAPRWMRRCGLEWLWRMISGGRKTFLRNCRCVSGVAVILLSDFLHFRLGRATRHPLHRNALP